MSKVCLVVRKLGSDEEITRVSVTNYNERHIEKVMMGMLRNMDTETYYVDDSEVDRAREADESNTRAHSEDSD